MSIINITTYSYDDPDHYYKDGKMVTRWKKKVGVELCGAPGQVIAGLTAYLRNQPTKFHVVPGPGGSYFSAFIQHENFHALQILTATINAIENEGYKLKFTTSVGTPTLPQTVWTMQRRA